MRQTTRTLALLLALLLTLTACAGGGDGGEGPAVPPAGNTVLDCAGREVTLPETTDRIACLYAYTGHVAALLGCEQQMVAVVNGLKRDELMRRKVANIADLPAPYSSGSINIEELAAAAPDLIFLRTENLEDAGEQEKLQGLGIPWLVVDYVTMEDQLFSIEMMGKALGKEERAAAYLAYYRDTIALVQERVAAIPDAEKKRVYHSVNEVVRTDIPGTLSHEVLAAAGCINVITDSAELRLDGDKGMVTVEQIYVCDPDVVLANEPEATAYFRNDSKFSGLRAVREGAVYQLPVGISRWAHPGSLESPLAALYIGKLLYPDQFADIDIEQEVLRFYKTYFDLSLTAEDLAAILAGEGMRQPKEGANQP
ncbi:MAG: ABC transporter substrate-binding protein [Clostridia bacterium]|nr:ABC transporter substrate-binding protein [Clostridia bacterium]